MRDEGKKLDKYTYTNALSCLAIAGRWFSAVRLLRGSYEVTLPGADKYYAEAALLDLSQARPPPRRPPHFFFNVSATSESYNFSIHVALPI